MLLSIIVPAFNMETYLDECLHSLSGSALSGAIEVIVVDDGSTDGTAKIAEAYVSRDPIRYRLVKKENGGHGSAVNAGIMVALGKYVRVVDADDRADKDGLLRVLSEMKVCEADVIADERIRFHDGVEDFIYDTLPESVPCGTDVDLLSNVSMDLLPLLNMHTLSARRDFVSSVGLSLLANTYYVDFQYAFVLLTKAKNIRFVRETVYCYRVGNVQQSVHYLNYVRRYEDHDRVLKACVRSTPGGPLATRMLVLLVHTQYKIALIFDPDGPVGRQRARALKDELALSCPQVERGARGRYYAALFLNLTGFRRLLLKKIRGYAS